jgi:hypothetical protein
MTPENIITVSNIDWDYDDDNIWDEIVSGLDYEIKDGKIQVSRTCKFHEPEEVFDMISEALHHNSVTTKDVFNLPDEVEIDTNTIGDSDEDITNYLTDTYGFFIKGYAKSTDVDMIKM